ncbi:MAG: toll/interleukin-1 receptor domain-containing protein [Betaproteobacteria bacterium]|nr:toll/interleukin-1 receptor domain-containing protein [Betaproteobacteria bacterium]
MQHVTLSPAPDFLSGDSHVIVKAMATLFISYRRDDWSPARLLNSHLEQQFDVFLDVEDIAPGDAFPERLREALADCKVCFVIIGPGWMSERNLARLNQPGDWVREELTTVLQGTGVRTIPLLVGGTQLPLANQLPDVLQPLLARNALTLSHEKWDQECEHLAGQIPSWLSQPMQRVRERQIAPAVLPYLCDRVEQADDVLNALDAPTEAIPNTYLYTLPGHKWEGHEGLLERLTYERIFETAFSAEQTGVAVRPLEWNRDQAKRGQYDILLRRAIKRGAMQLPAAADEALMRFLREAVLSLTEN